MAAQPTRIPQLLTWRLFCSKSTIGCAVVALIACLSSWAQVDLDQVAVVPRPTSTARGTSNATLRSRVDLVLVNVSVYDDSYRAVAGLGANDFTLQDNKHSQQIRSISNEDEPVSMIVVFDASGSMNMKIQVARYAVQQLVNTSNPQDEFSLVFVSSKPRLVLSFDDPMEELQARTADIQADGYTALWDGIYLGMQELRHARHQRKALIVISDGEDNHSRYSESEVKSALEESDAEMYAIGTFERSLPHRFDEKRAPMELDDLASSTGGRLFSAFQPEEIPKAIIQISRELRDQYVLGYYIDPQARDGRWHKITVRLSGQASTAKLHVHSKKGYYAAIH
jgi:Ca-activated chloride channel homolog